MREFFDIIHTYPKVTLGLCIFIIIILSIIFNKDKDE